MNKRLFFDPGVDVSVHIKLLDHFKYMYFEFRQHAEEVVFVERADVSVMDLIWDVRVMR